MQGYLPAAGSFSGAHLAPRPPSHWVDSVNQLEKEHNWSAIVLRDMLLFMNPVEVPILTIHHSPLAPKHPRLRKLATPEAYRQSVDSLVKCGLLNALGNEKYSFNTFAHEAIYRAMDPTQRQNACNDAAYILYNKLPDQAEVSTCLPQHEEFWKRYFRHVLYHSRLAEAQRLRMSGYSAVLAIGAARYAFKEGDFMASKKLLQAISLDAKEVIDFDTVLVLAENLNGKNWAQFEVEFASSKPAGTAQQAVSVATSPLDLRIFQLKDKIPFYDDRHGDIAIMKEDTSEYAELCLGICIGDESNELKKLSCKYLYDGWYCTKRDDKQKAIENFGKALEVMGAQYEARVAPRKQGIRPSFTQDHLSKFSSRESDRYASILATYEADNKARGPLRPRVFDFLYGCAWYSVVTALADGEQKAEENALMLAEALRDDLAVEGCRSNLAYAQYHVARFLRKHNHKLGLKLAGELMKKAEIIGEELDGPLWLSSNISESLKGMVWRYG